MKFLNQLRHLFFAIMLLGVFASAAQNEYGVAMIYNASVLIAVLFFIEAIYYKVQYKKVVGAYLVSEHFWMGAFMTGNFFKYMHWPGAGPLMVLAMFFLVIQYFIYGSKNLFKNFKQDKLQSIFVFFFFILTISAIAGFTFKIMHWPFGTALTLLGSVGTITWFLFVTVRRMFFVKSESVTIIQNIALLRGKIIVIMCYFVFWGSYSTLSNAGVIPGLYTLSKPPAFERLSVSGSEVAASKYWDSYEKFIENREFSESNHKNIKIVIGDERVK